MQMECADARMYPNIANLLTIILTLPVTNAEAERSFSALKRLKTYLRNTISEDRLNGLALLTVHNERHVSVDHVINRFAIDNRRLLFS